MKVRIFSTVRPEGVERDASILPLFDTVVATIEASGVYRGTCPCCDKPIVVRGVNDRPSMSAGDEHYLLHGSPPQ